MHMYCQHNRTPTYVLHDRIVVSIEPGKVFLVAQKDVCLETVFIVRVDASSNTGIFAYPISGVNVDYSTH